MTSTNQAPSPSIAVLIPCLNEEVTIGKVVRDFRKYLPEATIYVFDNNCTDNTAAIAEKEGAVVIKESRPGKGYVIDAMFKKVEADYYVMVDGDDTYSAKDARKLVDPLISGEADVTVGTRLAVYTEESFRPLHVFGNNLFRGMVNWIFKSNLKDILSGYRGFTREYVKTIPILSAGFEVETEMTIRTLDARFTIKEIEMPYSDRPEGSESKLNTFRDGFRVLSQIITIAKAYKPFTFFGLIGLILGFLGLGFGTEVIMDYLEDDYVNKVPTAILSTGLILLSFGSIGIGLVLNTLSYRFRELQHIIRKSNGNR